MSEKKGIIKRLFDFVFKHPIASLLILVVLVAGGLVFTYESMHMTSNPEFCRKCHPNEGIGVLAEYDSWSESIHAANDVICVDCHTVRPGMTGYFITKTLTGLHDLAYEFILSEEEKIANLTEYTKPENVSHSVPVQVCLHCHSDSVNADNRNNYAMSFLGVQMRTLETVVNPEYRESKGMIDLLNDPVKAGVEPKHATHNDAGIECAQCHLPITGSPAHSGAYRGVISMSTCWNCHEEKRTEGLNPAANEDCVTCHVTQVGMQAGTAAKDYGIDVAEWMMPSVTCDGCHMIEGNTASLPDEETCLNCHEEGYDEMLTMFQEDFETNFAGAKDLWLGKVSERGNMTEEQKKAFNEYSELLRLMETDGSSGMHNSGYMSEIFGRMDELAKNF